MPVLLEIKISLLIKVLRYMSMAMLQQMLRILELVIFRFVTALQSSTSSLEICACTVATAEVKVIDVLLQSMAEVNE